MEKKTVLVAMSGGVDSSVAALLLQEQGYDIVGVTMDTGYGDAPVQAKKVCERLGIPHHVLDVKALFRSAVIDDFVNAYRQGCTPNPCVVCNQQLKFSVFLPLMKECGADYLATGHYVIKDEDDGVCWLHRAADRYKDQSYFLYRIPAELLPQCLFPLGEYTKTQIRELAMHFQLPSAEKKDSFDICFIPDGDYRSFLQQVCPASMPGGEILDGAGKKVGCHNGLCNYTVGQRRGLNMALGYPAYVTELDAENNTVRVGKKDDLLTDVAYSKDNCFFAPAMLNGAPFEADAQIRYKAAPQKATICPEENGLLRIVFADPVWGVSPGQSVVFYRGDRLLGGGVLIKNKIGNR